MGRVKRGIGYALFVQRDHTYYAHLTVRVILGVIEDAAKQYDECPTKEGLEKLEKIRAAGNSCKFLYGSYGHSIEFQWQADRDGWDRADDDYLKSRWYGCKVSECAMELDCAALFVRIMKQAETDRVNCYCSPEAFIEVLGKIGAKSISNADGLYGGYYVFTDGEDVASKISARPWGKLPAPEVAEAVAEPAVA